MSWRQVALVLVAVFVLTVMQAVLAGPLVTLQNDLVDSGDYSNQHWNGEQLIKDLFTGWFDMGLVGVFVLLGVVTVRAVRKQLAANRRGP